MVSTLNSGVSALDLTGTHGDVVVKRFSFNFNDANISTGVPKAIIPAGAWIIGTDAFMAASFNANSTNVATVGSNSTQMDNIIAAAGVDETSSSGTFLNIIPTGAMLGPVSADTTVFAKYTQTGGTAATSGTLHVAIKYLMNAPNYPV